MLRRGDEAGTVVREVTEADGEPIRPVVNLLVRELEPLERYLNGALAEPGSEGATVRRLGAPDGGREGEAGRRGGGLQHAGRRAADSELRFRAPPLKG